MSESWQLIRADDQAVLLPRLELATTFVSRFAGLQLRRPLSPDQGLLLEPCSSLHTCFMRFPIDVVMLDRDHVVVAIRRRLRPWRLLICAARTTAVIETACDALALDIGQRLEIAQPGNA